MAVCGNPENRHGIILAKNELAKAYGIVTAETVWQAQKKCPQLVLVPPNHAEYRAVSKRINAIYQQYTDMVEPFSIDESWLDVTGSRKLFGDGKTIADELRRRVREEIGVTISVGVSFNKVFAKMGSDYKKPDATTVITRANYKRLLFPLPVTDMLFVGKSAAEKLAKMHIATIGDLAQSDQTRLSLALGKLGETIWEYANGLEDSPVRRFDEEREIKSVGNGMTFRRNLEGLEDIKTGVLALADSVAMRLRKDGLQCWGVQVTIKDPEFRVISRQRQLNHATDLAKEISEEVLNLVLEAWKLEQPIRMLTVTAIHLTGQDTGYQTNLFAPDAAEKNEKQEKLEAAMDAIRGKYGKGAVRWGRTMKNDLGIDED